MSEAPTQGLRLAVVVHVYPPIPDRRFDYQATWGEPEPGMPAGWGRTADEAIADLKELTDDN